MLISEGIIIFESCVHLKLKATRITLPVPKHLNKKQTQVNQYEAIELNAVYAYDGEHEWILLTSLPIENQEQLQEVISIYQDREKSHLYPICFSTDLASTPLVQQALFAFCIPP